MSGNLKQFIQFSRSERRGISILVILCLLSVGYNRLVPPYISKKMIRQFEHEHSDLLRELRGETDVVFDPEKREDSINFTGIAVEQQAVGKDDPEIPVKNKTIPVEPVRSEVKELRINTASASQLIKSGLVSKKIAYRIVKYRESLGGFLRTDQLLDVYELTDSIYEGIVGSVVLENVELKRLNVNTASSDILMEHPYIHKGLANQIVNYREKVKLFDGESDLLKLYFMDEVLLNKLSPYLDFKSKQY